MIGFFMFLFVSLSILLVLFILLQQGKGDMGLGSLGRGGQMLFGGSGGKDFFERATWMMGALFLVGALSLTIVKTKVAEKSRLAGYRAPIAQQANPQTAKPNTNQQTESDNTPAPESKKEDANPVA